MRKLLLIGSLFALAPLLAHGGCSATPAEDSADADAPDTAAPDAAPDATDDSAAGDAGSACSANGSAGSHLEFGADTAQHVVLSQDLGIPAPDMTIEAWVRWGGWNEERLIFAKEQAGVAKYQFRFAIQDGRPYFMMSDDLGWSGELWTDAGYGLIAAAPLTFDWHHVAVTRKGATFNLYVDAALVSTKRATIGDHAAKTPAVIGNRATFDISFDGDIDEVRLWSVERTPAEIACDMGRKTDPWAAGLVAAWSLNEGTGTTVADLKGKFPGTITGAVFKTDRPPF